MIQIKTKQEIETMREGGKILAGILKKLVGAVKLGITTAEIDNLARKLIKSSGAKPSFLGYNDFPAAVCTSINEEVVHGVPSDRKLVQGDVLKIDVGIFYKGFHTDTATTVIVSGGSLSPIRADGKENKNKIKLLDITREALNVGISKAVVGNKMGDIGSAIQKFVESQDFNVVRELIGHGVGKELHEEPEVSNYGEAGKGLLLKEGMVIAIEPMVVTGDWHVQERGMTFSTKDKSLSAHFEHTVAITKAGPDVLTLS